MQRTARSARRAFAARGRRRAGQLLVAAAVLAPGRSAAQLPGTPTLSPGRPNQHARLVLHALVGRAPAESDGGGWTTSALASYLVGRRLTLAAGAGRADLADVGARWQAAGSVAFAALHTDSGRVLSTVSVASSVGQSVGGAPTARLATLSVPLDVAFDMHGYFVEPFVVPHVRARRTTRDGAAVTQRGAGISAGVRVGLAIGASLVAAVDHSRYRATGDGGAGAPGTRATNGVVGLRLVLRTRSPRGAA